VYAEGRYQVRGSGTVAVTVPLTRGVVAISAAASASPTPGRPEGTKYGAASAANERSDLSSGSFKSGGRPSGGCCLGHHEVSASGASQGRGGRQALQRTLIEASIPSLLVLPLLQSRIAGTAVPC
jgi:hypothetical protein